MKYCRYNLTWTSSGTTIILNILEAGAQSSAETERGLTPSLVSDTIKTRPWKREVPLVRIKDLRNISDDLRALIRDMPEQIQERCQVKRIGPGVEIFRKHEKMQYVYILCEGECDVLTAFKGGQMYVFGKAGIKKGVHLIGEQEVLAEIDESQATVRTVTECRFLQLTKADFWAWIQQDPHASIILLKQLAKRLNEATREAGTQLYYPNIYQLKKYLVERFEETAESVVRIKAKRQQIADELGISLRSVERGVRELKEQGMVHIVKGKMEICKAEYQAILKTLDE